MKLKEHTLLAVIHWIVGAVLLFLTPVIYCVLDDNLAGLYSLHATMPLVPCIGLGWMLLGALISTGNQRVFGGARIIHIIWLCFVGCIGALGVAFVGLHLLTGRGRALSDTGSLAWFGIYLFVLSAIAFGVTVGVLVFLRDLRRESQVTPRQKSTRLRPLIVSVAISMSLAAISMFWQVSIEEHRQLEQARDAREQSQSMAYDVGAVRLLGFSTDGQYLASAVEYSDLGVRIWDVDSGILIHEFDFIGTDILSLAFLADSKHLVVGFGRDQTGGFAVVDIEQKVEVFRNDDYLTTGVAVSDDGRLFVTCGRSGYGSSSSLAPFSVWEIDNFAEVFKSKPRGNYLSVVLSNSGTQMALRGQREIEIWPFPLEVDAKPIQSFRKSGGSDVASMTFFADDSMLAIAGGFESTTIKLSGGDGRSDNDSKLPTTGAITAGQFSPDRTTLVVASQSQSVQLIELETKSLIRTMHAPYFVHGIAISADNQLIAVGGQKQIILLDANTGAIVREMSQRN